MTKGTGNDRSGRLWAPHREMPAKPSVQKCPPLAVPFFSHSSHVDGRANHWRFENGTWLPPISERSPPNIGEARGPQLLKRSLVQTLTLLFQSVLRGNFQCVRDSWLGSLLAPWMSDKHYGHD